MSARAESPAPGPGRPARKAGTGEGGTRKALVEAQIVATATELFAERGFAGTSLQDIADEMGLTRPALYHYFSSKEALLALMVTEATEGPAEQLQQIRKRKGASVVDRVREMAATVAYLQASQPARFRALIRSEGELPEPLAVSYDEGRRGVLREFTTVIAEGVRSGELRPLDPRTAALGIIGLCNWVAWWHHSGGEQADRQVADSLADMAVASVASAELGGAAVEGGGAARALRRLKHDVEVLERFLPPDQV